VVVNSPSNPTGSVFSAELMERIAAVASRNGLWVISDEVYDQITYDQRPTAMRPLYPERTLSVYSFSKTYAMTGWRLGYLVTPQSRVDATKKMAETVYSSTSMVAQEAALAALAVPDAEIQTVVDTYRRRRDLALAQLRQWGLYRYTPGGAFYLMVDVSGAGDAGAVHRRMIEEKGVVTVPGSAFGASAAGELRLSLAASDEDIGRALGALGDLLDVR
jgi:aspartate aminotransferase/aminotransferase